MFGRSNSVSFQRYAYSQRRRRSWWPLPGWLTLLLFGILLGAGGLWYAQEEYLPPRLSAAESELLQNRLVTLEGERDRLQNDLRQTADKLQASEAQVERLTAELAKARTSIADLEEDIALFVVSLPPDPRSGDIGVRSARFEVDKGQLSYRVLMTDDRAKTSAPFKGVLVLEMLGRYPGRAEERLALEPMPVSIDRYAHAQGLTPLPDGFEPRQVTIRVLDRPDGTQLGLRIYNVR